MATTDPSLILPSSQSFLWWVNNKMISFSPVKAKNILPRNNYWGCKGSLVQVPHETDQCKLHGMKSLVPPFLSTSTDGAAIPKRARTAGAAGVSLGQLSYLTFKPHCHVCGLPNPPTWREKVGPQILFNTLEGNLSPSSASLWTLQRESNPS